MSVTDRRRRHRFLTQRFARWLLDVWFFRATLPGKVLLIATLLTWITGTLSVRVPIYHLLCALMALLTVSLLSKYLLRPNLRMKGQFPHQVIAGQSFVARYTVENVSSRPVFDLGLHFLKRHTPLVQLDTENTSLCLAPSKMLDIPIKILPPRRGMFDLPDLHVSSAFPFNLWRSSLACCTTQPVLVLPHFHPLVSVDIPVGRRYQPGGITLTSNIGESPEYMGNRDYRPGDPTRWLDFRSWARLAKPVVKEYQEEYYCRIALVLDTFVEPGRKRMTAGFPELEAAVSLAAAIADTLSREEYLVDLFAAGPDLYVFRAGRSIAHFENILEILACVEECRSNPFERIAPALVDELTNITAVIFVLLDWDEAREQFVRKAVEAGSSAKVILVRHDAPSKDTTVAEEWAGAMTTLSPETISGGAVEMI